MSKYEPLWTAVAVHDENDLQLTFTEIEAVLGFPIDHAFLNFKKELTSYGWQVEKISLKEKWVRFSRCGG